LLLHGDRQAKCGQLKSPRTLTGKIYNKRSVDWSQSGMSEDDNNNFEDNFDEEFDEEEETGFGTARGRGQLVSDSRSPQTWAPVLRMDAKVRCSTLEPEMVA
jgi:hypothetical protein